MGRTSVELQVYTNIPNFTSDHIYITRMSSAKEPGKEIPWRLYLLVLLYIRYITRVLLIELHEFIVYDFSVAISVSVSKECAANSSMGWVFKKNVNTYEKCELHVHVYKKHLNWTCKHYAIYIHKHVTHTFHFYVLLFNAPNLNIQSMPM